MSLERCITTAALDAGPIEYRWDRRDGPTVVIFHGGHMRAELVLGEDVFAEAGCSVLVPSRPGYGRTPLFTGGSAAGSAIHMVMRRAPDAGLRVLLGDLSTRPAREVMATLVDSDRAALVALFSRMRSGHGFVHDLVAAPDTADVVTQPTLVIASREDGAVPYAHAQALATMIQRSTLFESQANSHFIWFSPDWPVVGDRIRRFLASNGEDVDRVAPYPGTSP